MFRSFTEVKVRIANCKNNLLQVKEVCFMCPIRTDTLNSGRGQRLQCGRGLLTLPAKNVLTEMNYFNVSWWFYDILSGYSRRRKMTSGASFCDFIQRKCFRSHLYRCSLINHRVERRGIRSGVVCFTHSATEEMRLEPIIQSIMCIHVNISSGGETGIWTHNTV